MAQEGEPVAVTLHTVARRAGVSTATVSRVLMGSSAAESTRVRVFAAAREVGYTPPGRPRPPVAARHDAQGLVLAGLTGSYFSELVMGFDSAASEKAQSVALVVARRLHDASEVLHDLTTRVDGLAIGANTVPDSVAQELSSSLPVVLLARRGVAGCDSVRSENLGTAALLTAHLLEHGRSHLVNAG